MSVSLDHYEQNKQATLSKEVQSFPERKTHEVALLLVERVLEEGVDIAAHMSDRYLRHDEDSLPEEFD